VSVQFGRSSMVLQYWKEVFGRVRKILCLGSRQSDVYFVNAGVSEIDFVCRFARRATENSFFS
jgi:hypothetical protein